MIPAHDRLSPKRLEMLKALKRGVLLHRKWNEWAALSRMGLVRVENVVNASGIPHVHSVSLTPSGQLYCVRERRFQ